MATIVLKAEARHGKYGVVTVLNPDQTLNREYKITEAQVAAWHLAGKWTADTHIGVTQAEWESGLAQMAGFDFDVGDMRLEADGSLLIKFAEGVFQGRITQGAILLKPGEWSGTPPEITVAILPAISRTRIASIVGGVLETK